MGFLAGIFGALWTNYINNYLDERDKKRGIPVNYRNRLIDGIVILSIFIIIIFVAIFFAPAGI